jgi:hypothetical protein
MNKICIDCKEEKSLDNYYFRTDTKKYRNQCKRCRQDKINLYRRNNVEYKKRYNMYRKNKRNNDPNYLLKDRLRARIGKSLKCQNTKKCIKSKDLLGCDIETFKKYIESKFQEGMSWEKRNFELDHIIPCSYFDLTKEDEQKKCFHYTNQQPLTSKQNSIKSNKLPKSLNRNTKIK